MTISFSGKAVAITGGCGFIGSHLVDALVAAGASRIVIVDSMDFGHIRNLTVGQKELRIINHRLGSQSYGPMMEALDKVDYLFHLAAEKHNQSIDSPLRVIESNITGTHELLKAAVERKVTKVVFTSSLYAYGRMKGGPFVESESLTPSTVYGISKLAGEHLCWHFHEKFGLNAVCLRYLFVYGPRQYANLGYKSVIVKNFENLLAGRSPVINGDGGQRLDYVYVADAVEMTLKAMCAPVKFDIFNVCTGSGVSVNELTQCMQDLAGTNYAPVFAPPDVTHGSSRVGSPNKAKLTLDFEAKTPLSTGLMMTFSWMKGKQTTQK